MCKEFEQAKEERKEALRKAEERCFFDSFDNKKFKELSLKQQSYIYEKDKAFFEEAQKNTDILISCHNGKFMTYTEKQMQLEKEYQERNNKQILSDTQEEIQEKQRELIAAEAAAECNLNADSLASDYVPLDIDKLIDESINRIFNRGL